MNLRLPWLDEDRPMRFPPPEQALDSPNGLLAAGGDLSPPRLLAAYRQGIFPWYSEGEPLLWWSPDPRCVFRTGALHVSRSLRRHLRRCGWKLRVDRAFDEVIGACADTPRAGQYGTWITAAMRRAYMDLHALGHAHSVEVYADRNLVGGIYGVSVGRLFCGESMFSHADNASKVALLGLCRLLQAWTFPVLDAQMPTAHLLSMGGEILPRADFLRETHDLAAAGDRTGSWRGQDIIDTAADLVHARPAAEASTDRDQSRLNPS